MPGIVARGRPTKLDRKAQAVMRGLLERGMNSRLVTETLAQSLGITINSATVRGYRRAWDIPRGQGRGRCSAPMSTTLSEAELSRLRAEASELPKVVAAPCDLCGSEAKGYRHKGARWGIEGQVCDQCRRELMAEAKALAARERKREEQEAKAQRAKARELNFERKDRVRDTEREAEETLVRAENGHLPLEVIDPEFTSWDLRGKAFSHWLLELMATDRRLLLLRTIYHDGTTAMVG